MFYKISKNKNISLKLSKSQKENITQEEEENPLTTYYYLYSKVPVYNFFISKMEKTKLFYELVELFSTIYFDFNKMIIGNFSTTKCFYEFLEFKLKDFSYVDLNLNTGEHVDFIFFDLTMLDEWVIIPMCKKLKKNGHSVIKMKYSKKVLEIIYVLSTIFEKTIITRPHIITSCENIYVICQHYNNTYQEDLGEFILENLNNLSIYENIPCHFINYMNEIQVYIKQQILFHKKNGFYFLNDDEKIEKIKSKNILNCIKWCESFNIPYNNIKLNIFNDKVKDQRDFCEHVG